MSGASYVHGTYTAYAHHGCRCDSCRTYQNDRVRRSRAQRLAEGRVRHGNSGWDDGCRCTVCRTAHNERHFDYAWRKFYEAGDN